MANERNSPSEPGERPNDVDAENIRGVAENEDDFEDSDDEDSDEEDDEESTTF